MNILDREIRENLYRHNPGKTGLAKTEDEGMVMLGGETKLIPFWANVDEFSIPLLRNLSSYLSDALLRKDAYVLLPDHLEYWSWSAAYASHYIPLESTFGWLLRDYYKLVQIVLLPHRHLKHDFDTRREIEALNRSLSGLAHSNSIKLVTLSLFPILEGLVRRFCPQIELDGKASERIDFDNVGEDLQPIGVDGRVSLGPALHIWQWFNASPRARMVLTKLDNVERYNLSKLAIMYGNIEENHGTTSFIDSIANIRNANLHGENWTGLIRAIILNLISLLIWDIAPTSNYEIRREVLRSRIYGEFSNVAKKHMDLIFDPLDWGATSGDPTNLYPV